MTERYRSAEAFQHVLDGFEQPGRRVRLPGGTERGQPVMVTEFGGLRYTPDGGPDEAKGTWGYSTVNNPDEFAARLSDWLDAVRASPVLAGFCYTQLTDTLQEANGLLDEDRNPKIAIERLRSIITGRPEEDSS